MLKTLLVIALISLPVQAFGQDMVLGHGGSRMQERDLAFFDRLGRETLSVSWRDQDLVGCVAELRERTGLNILVSGAAAATEFHLTGLELRRVSLLLVLQLLAEESGLELEFRRGLVQFKTAEEILRESAVTVIYDLRSRFYQPTDFPGPQLGLGASGFEESEREKEIRPEDPDFDSIVEILRSATGEQNWESDAARLTVAGQRLVVRHSPAMQRRIARLLDALTSCY